MTSRARSRAAAERGSTVAFADVHARSGLVGQLLGVPAKTITAALVEGGPPARRGAGRLAAGPLAFRAAIVDAYLAARPDVAESVSAELADLKASRTPAPARRTAVAGRSAEIVSQAQLHHLAKVVPASTAEVAEGLAEYLALPRESDGAAHR